MPLSLQRPRHYLFWATALVIAHADAAWGAPVGSSCASANLSANNYYNGEFDRESLPAFIVSTQTPVYREQRSASTPVRRLAFGSRVYVVEPADGESGTRAQVADYSDASNVYGWVDQEHLLCRRDPLRSDSGIWRRAFIKTATRVIDSEDELNYMAKIIYDDSQGKCEDDACGEIGVFKWFFIYAERDGKLLVSEAAQLRGNDIKLSGWLNLDDAIMWETASALRPSEKLDDSDPEDYVCAYPSPESINDPEQCRQVLGGERWFESSLRLPIIGDVGDDDTGYWRVLSQVAGSNLSQSDLLDSLLSTSSNANPTLSNLDVMFVIDGTRSMAPVIDAIKGANGNPGLVERLAERLGDKIDASNNYRIGFQIYRDSRLNGTDGVRNSASYSLANKPCQSDPTGFYKAFVEVEAQDDIWDSDFAENVYGGIMQAIKNLHSCPQHSKMIIVIGDHGYSGSAQSDRGHRSYSANSIIRALYHNQVFAQPPVLFFIQTPANNTNQRAYNSAYNLFADQARQLSEAWMRNNPQYEYLPANEIDREVRRAITSQFKRLRITDSSEQLLAAIVGKINSFFNPSLSAEPLVSGENMVMAEPNLQPHQLGTFDIAREMYIPKSQRDKLVREILMTDAQLNDWQGVLKAFRQLNPGRQTREQLLAVLKEKIGTNLGIDLDDTTDADKSLGEILQLKSGLPYAFNSPILQYTENDIIADIPACELAHVVEIAIGQLVVLDAIEQGDGLPVFAYEQTNMLRCATMTAKGQALRKIRQDDVVVLPFNSPVGDQKRSFVFSANNDQFYWLPIDWLP